MKRALNSPAVKVIIGLLIGVALLLPISRFVNLASSLYLVQQHIMTPAGITFTLLSGAFFILAFAIRGARWKLFLNPNDQVKTSTAVRLVLVSTFINFLLVTGSGELARSLILKRTHNIPVSSSLPSVTVDRSLDLLPALIIMIIVPFLGLQMDLKLWVIMGTVAGVFVGLVAFVGLTIWKRATAIKLLHATLGLLPRKFSSKIEAFATNLVDSLIVAASRPRIFLPAISLTCVAVICDGLFAMFVFWAIGLPMSFGAAIFGYTVFNMSFILPTTPGRVGSNEIVGLLVFTGLLHFPADKVTAMFLVSHPWSAVLMCVSGLVCLKSLGLTISAALKMRPQNDSQDISQASSPTIS
ncbi:hypothetical protein KSD_11570 [Ktedonobacter sp. SOSP1-85]|uniref:Flippase-like domain-containing protein n=1 Tax=Ktedonobacter robiniae TaxID=2778365 RepID=A0ABQ3URH9_9CHLR|nr:MULTISPECIES: lysylphosphatidylglycerol synthase transmembrane domain-containing protein [Ktedonobacter]GHO54970.1 hypothetical protein KSB_34450 [Ktedonobacter robiniae]GHO73386.1 hypothetical protein KSD_11570 [Ktedonobacter sp. SOSP1-85]